MPQLNAGARCRPGPLPRASALVVSRQRANAPKKTCRFLARAPPHCPRCLRKKKFSRIRCLRTCVPAAECRSTAERLFSNDKKTRQRTRDHLFTRRALLANERAAITCSSSAVRNSVLAHLARERVTAQHCCHIASETAPLAARGAAAATHLVCFGSATRPEMGARRRWYGSETRRAPAAAAGEPTAGSAAGADAASGTEVFTWTCTTPSSRRPSPAEVAVSGEHAARHQRSFWSPP